MADPVPAALATDLDTGEEVPLPLQDIRRAKLVLTDALIEATAQAPSPEAKMAN